MGSYTQTEGRRVIGRILSLGFPLPGVRVDNYNFCSAPSFFDYDAIVVDPPALSQLIEGVIDGSAEAKTFGGAPVRNTARQPGEAALGELLLRRRDETRRLLERGGVVVFFGHPPQVHGTIDGMDALNDFYWLGEHAPELVAGDGTQADICDYEHALAPFVLGQLANLQYRAHVRDGGRVFVRSYGGAAIGADLPSDDGRIVMLPALRSVPAGDGRYAMSDALQSGIRRMLGVVAEGRPPHWIAQHPLPGSDARAGEVASARASVAAAEVAMADAEQAHEEVARFQRLLWQQGQVGLEDVVLDALKLIGCEVYGNDSSALELRVDGTRVLFEIDASEGAVDLAPHYRLRQRIERTIQQRGAAPRAAIIINGYRLDPPAERRAQASDALRASAETMRYALIPTTALFDGVAAKLSGDDAPAAALRDALRTAEGLAPANTATPQEQ